MSPQEENKETWFNRRWRPAMAWSYMVICIFDFIAAPILWSILQATYKGNVTEAWAPLTLQGAGLFHLAMGAILGVTAWSRGQEKMEILNQSSSTSNRQSYSNKKTSLSKVPDPDGEMDCPPPREVEKN